MTEANIQRPEDWLRRAARRLGLTTIGITNVHAIGEARRHFEEFLDHGRHGEMGWLADTAERRGDPHKLWPDARSIIMLGESYAPDHDPLDSLAQSSNGVISVYARGRDYHDILKSKIRALAQEFSQVYVADVRIFVDTAPLLEKPLAAAAGLGWQGKHTNLVSREHGSWLFLGAILTTAELAWDAPEVDHCGSCSRCLDICPTDAFPAPYQLDARRCLAYLTIEYKGHIPQEFREPLKNRVFGCDDCLAVCPWNRFATAAREVRYAARSESESPPLDEFLSMDDAAFRKRFAGTPVKRTGRDRIVRNALIAAGNSGDTRLLPAVETLLSDPSRIVRAMAVWALGQLAGPDKIAAYRSAIATRETDPGVQLEWLALDP